GARCLSPVCRGHRIRGGASDGGQARRDHPRRWRRQPGDAMKTMARGADAPPPYPGTIAPVRREVDPAAPIARNGTAEAARRRRWSWAKQVRQWHWISSAICLVGMLGFAVTGITLNHAGAIESAPVTVRRASALDTALSDD